jgi:hypothetical protein
MNDAEPPPSLPPFVEAARVDVENDPDGAEARGLALMQTSATTIADGVHERVVPYVVTRAGAVLDAWGRVGDADRAAAMTRLATAAGDARDRVERKLRALLATDPEQQGRTPLEIVRTLRAEPTEVLAALGVGEIVRDEFEQRALPDDPYGLAPRTLAELGDEDLGPMLLAWGIGKAMVVRARAAKRRSALADGKRSTTRGDEGRRNPMRIVGGGLRRFLRALSRGRGGEREHDDRAEA